MHKISLYYSLQDFFGHNGCPPELTPALTFHEMLLLYRDTLSQFQALIFHSSGTSHLPCNTHFIWHRQTLIHSPLLSLQKLSSLYLRMLSSSCLTLGILCQQPSKQMSFSPRLCTYTLIMATAASPQLTSVDGYLPLPHLMTSGLYCSRKEGN